MRQFESSLQKAGKVAFGIQAVLMLTLMILHQLGWINAWHFPLLPVSVFLIGGGLSCWLWAWWRTALPQRQMRSGRHRLLWRWRTQLLTTLTILVLCLNGLTYLAVFHATHTRDPETLGFGIPRPMNDLTPLERELPYQTVRIPVGSAQWLEAWQIPTQQASARGSVILFPGNLGTKSSQLLAPAQSFGALGYDTLLVDFQGVGGSTGNVTTIGMAEAQDVVAAVQFQESVHPNQPIVLYGVSMGSAAILRAIAQMNLHPTAIIIELPFARLVNALRSRISAHRLPGFPTAELMVFWGSVQHGYNGFHHNPRTFAQAVHCPALVIHGAQDPWTTVSEVKDLFQQLRGPKQLVITERGGHHQLIGVDRPLWDQQIQSFLHGL